MTRHILIGSVVALLTASTIGSAASPPPTLASPLAGLQPDLRPSVDYGPANDMIEQIAAAVGLGTPLFTAVAPGGVGVAVESAAPMPDPPRSLRDRALQRFRDLGALAWQVATFDCIGWFESKWTNATHVNANGSVDRGVVQINSVHDGQLRAQGLDPFNPEDAATYAWQLSRDGTTFSPWSVHGLCGV